MKNEHQAWSPLHYAVTTYKPDIKKIKHLINGVDVNIRTKDKYNWTPLHIARREPKVFKLLIDAGADVNARDGERSTPLLNVMSHDYENVFDVVKLLIDAGADVNAQDSIGNTPLHNAVLDSHDVAAVRLLLKAGANPNIKNNFGTLAAYYYIPDESEHDEDEYDDGNYESSHEVMRNILRDVTQRD